MFLFIYLIFSLFKTRMQETKKKILQIHVWGLEVGTYVHALSFQVWLSFKKLVSSHKLLTARHRTLCSLGLDEHGLSRSYFWTRSDESSCFLHPCHHLESDDTMNAWAQMLVCVTKKNSSCWFHLRNVKVWIKWTAVLMNACWAVCSCRGHFVSDLQTVTINYWKWLMTQTSTETVSAVALTAPGRMMNQVWTARAARLFKICHELCLNSEAFSHRAGPEPLAYMKVWSQISLNGL